MVLLSNLFNASRLCHFALRVRQVAVWAMLLGGFGSVFGADGDYRVAYVPGSSSLVPMLVGSPAIDTDGTIYISASFLTQNNTGAIIALNPGNMSQKWRFSTGDRIEATPVIGSDGTLYVGCFNGVFYAIDKQTGKEKWHYNTYYDSTEQTDIASTAAISADGSTIYVGVSTSTYPWAGLSPGALYAFGTDGSVKWRKWVLGAVESSPVTTNDGTVYFASFDRNIYAVNPDGSEKWHRTLDGVIEASPAIAGDGTIYIGTAVDQFVALTPDNQIKWQVGLTVRGSAAVGADGTVYVGNWADAGLYALNGGDGTTKWKVTANPAWGSTPTVRADGVVLFGGEDYTLRAYNPSDGSVRWSYKTGYPIYSSPAISPTDHGIYVTSSDGRLYALQGNDSGLSSYSSWPTFQHNLARAGLGDPSTTAARLINLSTRGQVLPGNQLIAGFVIQGGTQSLLIRAAGPSLSGFHVSGALPNPNMVVKQLPSVVFVKNDDWGNADNVAQIVSVGAKVGAFPFDVGSKDAAVLASILPATNFAEVVDSADGASGVAMAEIYDSAIAQGPGYLVNVSTRGQVGTGDNVLIAGLVVGGSGRLHVLIRGIGPGLTPFSVPGALAQPMIQLYDAKSTPLQSNTGWTSGGLKGDLAGAATLVSAFPLSESSADSAMIAALDPGIYSVVLSGAGGSTGTGLVEVYALPY